jgi:plasmid stabilization system protein ParE
MKFALKITDEARELLRSAAKWYVETSHSKEIAAAWYDGFIAALEMLEENPELGGLAPESDQFDFELRELCYGSGKRLTHRALYRIVGTTVEVLSIRHHAQRPVKPSDL